MHTISETLQDLLSESPWLRDLVASDLGNLSAIARQLQPEIKKRLWKTTVSQAAVMMALKRIQQKYQRSSLRRIDLSGLGDMTVRSNLQFLIYENSPVLIRAGRALFDLLDESKEHFLNISQGVFETSILVTTPMFDQVKALLKKQKPVYDIQNLSSITIRIPHKSTFIPGYFYNILRPLALDQINIVDITSVNREITLIFEDKDIERAFTTLKQLQKRSKVRQQQSVD